MAGVASKIHKWLALLMAVQILFWFVSGLFFAVFPIERVRSEHMIAEAPPRPVPFGVAADGLLRLGSAGAAAERIEIRVLLGRPVALLTPREGRPALYDLAAQRRISPVPMALAARIAELSHMALGRLYYERDQPSKSVDEYLRISRRSDLFDEALYEVTWVYVKNKEFDKALRALELLALADPTSQRMPDVRILEGNLRIRKAQAIEAAGPVGGRVAVVYALGPHELSPETACGAARTDWQFAGDPRLQTADPIGRVCQAVSREMTHLRSFRLI